MKRVFLASFIVLFFLTHAYAQFDTGSVLGSLHDQSGSVVAGATVTLTNADTGITLETKSNDQGYYEFPTARIGRYTVKAEKEGFAAAVAENLVLSVSARQRVDLALKIGTAS